jgi:RHS repeat-associated protein
VADSALSGPVTGGYDADGALVTQSFPTGMTQTITRDTDADPTRVVWAEGGVEWANDSQSSSIHGQWRWHSGPAAWQAYGYDGAGRLKVVWDQQVGQDCVQRGYRYDVNSNRTQSDAWPPAADGACPPPTTSTGSTHAYDGADRLLPQGVDAGLGYDAFGRSTALPASAAGGTAATASYYVTDIVAGQSHGTTARSWSLDPAGRLRAATLTGNPTRTNHYGDASSDSPSWIDENTGAATLAATRYLTALDGNLAAEITHTGTTSTSRWQLVNLHGDIVTTAADNATLSTPDGATLDADEYGRPRGAATPRYGWLGGKQRSTDALAGLTLMGVRLYNPTLGRFLQTDPVPCGSANRYDYARQDPLNTYDLDGRQCTASPSRIWGLYDFRGACFWHDWCYRVAPYGRTYWGRYRCDFGFLVYMLASCQRMHPWWSWKRYVCYRIARQYYWAVRWYGWYAFYF